MENTGHNYWVIEDASTASRSCACSSESLARRRALSIRVSELATLPSAYIFRASPQSDCTKRVALVAIYADFGGGTRDLIL